MCEGGGSTSSSRWEGEDGLEGGGSFSRTPTRVHLWGGRVGGAGGQSKCEGDERGVA